MPRYQELSSWTPVRVQQHVDPVLLNDKRFEISREMQPKSLAARRSARNDHQWAIAELDVIDQWAEKLAAAWLEIWDIQGFPRCHALYRAIYEGELRNLFSDRQSAFTGHLNRRALVKRSGNSQIGGWFAREMEKRVAKWNRRMDVDSRKAMHAARRVEATTVPTAQSSSGLNWKELELRFRDIQAKTTEQRVSTNFIRTEWESGVVNKEWIVSGNLALGKEFELLASVAARKLGCTRSENLRDYWLDRVLEWMQQVGLDKDKQMAWRVPGRIVVQGASATTDGLYTEKIAELSAMFCMELMTCGTPESAVSLHSERSERESPQHVESPEDAPRLKDQGLPERKAGRKQSRNREFIGYAGTLWRNHQGPNMRVSQDALKQIATHLDKSVFSKPSDYLEARAAERLKKHNQKYGNSPKKLSTWTEIVTRGCPSLKVAMRKLLSRCARTSGN